MVKADECILMKNIT